MPIQNKSNLRTWFSTFKYPTQSQFWDWLDSYWHKLEKIPVNMIDGLTELLSGFASSAALNNHANDKNNPHDVSAAQVGAASASDLQALETDITTNTNNITTLETELQGIQQELAEKEHFRGYFTTSAQIQALASPKDGDFAYNAETGTKWTYFNSSWGDTGEAVPDQVTPKTTTVPLMDGTAAIGDENAYAAGNHRHPTDSNLQAQISANKYTLPPATIFKLGGVKPNSEFFTIDNTGLLTPFYSSGMDGAVLMQEGNGVELIGAYSNDWYILNSEIETKELDMQLCNLDVYWAHPNTPTSIPELTLIFPRSHSYVIPYRLRFQLSNTGSSGSKMRRKCKITFPPYTLFDESMLAYPSSGDSNNGYSFQFEGPINTPNTYNHFFVLEVHAASTEAFVSVKKYVTEF